jgi:hypothetical protein
MEEYLTDPTRAYKKSVGEIERDGKGQQHSSQYAALSPSR